MNFDQLEKNIIDVIKEEQVKLGYQKERIRLYYPLDSLNIHLGVQLQVSEMTQALRQFSDYVQERLGTVEISSKAERFCLSFSPQATEFVHDNTPGEGFLYDFVNTIARHDITVEQVLQQFRKYSDQVYFEEIHNGEFDYLVYFKDGQPDAYRYCLTEEGHHIIYHRYSAEEYRLLMQE